jgi:hypothetical protein
MSQVDSVGKGLAGQGVTWLFLGLFSKAGRVMGQMMELRVTSVVYVPGGPGMSSHISLSCLSLLELKCTLRDTGQSPTVCVLLCPVHGPIMFSVVWIDMVRQECCFEAGGH